MRAMWDPCPASVAGGMQATAAAPRRTSKYRGVCWNKKNRRWQASINVGGKYMYLGSFQKEEQAAKAFDTQAFSVRQERAKLNFPDCKARPRPWPPCHAACSTTVLVSRGVQRSAAALHCCHILVLRCALSLALALFCACFHAQHGNQGQAEVQEEYREAMIAAGVTPGAPLPTAPAPVPQKTGAAHAAGRRTKRAPAAWMAAVAAEDEDDDEAVAPPKNASSVRFPCAPLPCSALHAHSRDSACIAATSSGVGQARSRWRKHAVHGGCRSQLESCID